ncbi:regulatory protein RecX [uncultured Duncaniella sp.]|uniref:regulatory protein RecX n=1 Tax=uncultured Duncaniella sp. TaxID=2768039 RepID=UPI00265FB322|nr:regulatory protein RecX [uncultured Duncaniella sp.]
MRNSRSLNYEQALSRTAELCSRCEQCTPVLRKKMSTWGVPAGDADRVIRKLEELNFVDDFRYARAYAYDKLEYSGWGRNKIIQGLWAKRLSRAAIEQSLSEIEDEQYVDIARRVIKAKIRQSKEGVSTFDSRMKILRFAMQRGFEARIASSLLKDIIREMDDTDTDNETWDEQ